MFYLEARTELDTSVLDIMQCTINKVHIKELTEVHPRQDDLPRVELIFMSL